MILNEYNFMSIYSLNYCLDYCKPFYVFKGLIAYDRYYNCSPSLQVELIKKGLTQCYECQPKAPQKTFPGCTIRNTPSEPIHCIVWAKHLFNQLFGEEDPDQDVSPDTADPEAAGDAGSSAMESEGSRYSISISPIFIFNVSTVSFCYKCCSVMFYKKL